MSEPRFLDTCREYFYLDKTEAKEKLTPLQYEKLIRFEKAYTQWFDNPWWSETAVAKWMMDEYQISRAQAFRDVADIKFILNSVQEAKKEWERYKANTYIDEGFKLAKDAVDKIDVLKATAMIAAGKAKDPVNRLNKNDPDKIPWEKIQPLDMEPVNDVSLLKTKRKSPKELQAEIANMFKDLDGIEEAEIIDE